MGRYSRDYETRRALDRLDADQVRHQSRRAAPTAQYVHKVAHRLTAEQIESIVNAYLSGVSSSELAVRFGLGKGTVLNLLRQQGVHLRRQGLDLDQLAQASQFYSQGLSLARVGQRLGVHPGSVWWALQKAGVEMRARHQGS